MYILVLGHKGMLGRTVYDYFSKDSQYTVTTIAVRWGDLDFEQAIRDRDPQYIINAIGLIPQKKSTDDMYRFVNTDLPLFLDTLGIRVIHPSTDCEFSGSLAVGEMYTKKSPRDAKDVYGQSKVQSSQQLEQEGKNTKILRTSIIGHEIDTSVALLDWFLHAHGEVKGFTNHYWNGITTLEWAKQAHRLIQSWDSVPVLNQVGTEPRSKYDLLCSVKDIYEKDITITPYAAVETQNKCLASDHPLERSIQQQLMELKEWYGR